MNENESHITPQALFQRCKNGLPSEILDVRTPPEFTDVHVPGARLATLDALNPVEYLGGRSAKNDPLFVICQSGARAGRAIEKFRTAGFDGCVLVEGGTQAWIDAGLPVERGQSRVIPLMRQVQIVVGILSAIGAALAIWIHPWFGLIPLFMGCGLLFAGITGSCPLALLLAKMPWNRRCGCSGGSCCS